MTRSSLLLLVLPFLWGKVCLSGQEAINPPEEQVYSSAQFQTWIKEGNADQVLTFGKQMLAAELPKKTQAQIHLWIATAYEQKGSLDSALLHLKQGQSFFEQIRSYEGMAKAEQQKGNLYLNQNEPDKARESLLKALNYAASGQLSEIEYYCYRDLAVLYSGLEQYNIALESLRKALAIAKKANDPSKVIDTYDQLSTNFYSLGILDSGVVYFEQMLAVKKRAGVTENELIDLQTLGKLYLEKGEAEKAQINLLKALSGAENQRDTFFIISLCTDLGKAYAAQALWLNARQYAQRALDLARAKDQKLMVAINLQNLADIAKQGDELNKALDLYTEALNQYQELNNTLRAADIHLELSDLYQSQNNYNQARAYVRQAMSIRQGQEDMMGLLQARLLLGELEYKANNPGQAEAILLEAHQQAKDMDHQIGRAQALRLLAETASRKGAYQKAFQHLKAYQALNDSLISERTAKAMGELEVLYQTEKKDRAILAQQVELDRQLLQIRQRNIQLLFLLGTVGLLLLSFFFFYLISRKNRQLQQQRMSTLKKEQEAQNLRAVMQGEEKERKRIAQDLHDGLGAQLATVKMRLQSLEHDLPQVRQMDAYCMAETHLDTSFRTIREISQNMMPSVLEEQGLPLALQDLCSEFHRAHNLSVNYIPHGLDYPLNREQQLIVFRIVQELLRNVEKHAQAREVIVQLTIEDHLLHLVVEDDGTGFSFSDSHLNSGMGLRNIRSRVEYLGGTLEVDSIPEEGSTFSIEIPLKQIA